MRDRGYPTDCRACGHYWWPMDAKPDRCPACGSDRVRDLATYQYEYRLDNPTYWPADVPRNDEERIR